MNSAALNALDQTVAIARQRAVERVPVVGVAGPQGSGKTTLAKAYAVMHPGAVHFSLDDFYVGHARRAEWARDGHPLLATRGPPPTHDVASLTAIIERLRTAGPETRVSWPVFDKVKDDPIPQERWPVHVGRPDLILIDGWCIGAKPQDEAALIAPVNRLEMQEDAEGHWRRLVNHRLGAEYSRLFDHFDGILYLRAPSFAVVMDWRCEQEEGLLGRSLTAEDRRRIARFIEHFERITRHMMAGGRRADIEVQLDVERNVTEIRRFAV